MAIMTDIETRLRERLSRPGRVQISAKTWSTAYAAIGAPKVFESAEALSFAAARSPIISRTTLVPASLFVMIESSCEAQVTSRPQYYPNSSRTDKYRKTRLCLPMQIHLPDKSRNRKLGESTLPVSDSAPVLRLKNSDNDHQAHA